MPKKSVFQALLNRFKSAFAPPTGKKLLPPETIDIASKFPLCDAIEKNDTAQVEFLLQKLAHSDMTSEDIAAYVNAAPTTGPNAGKTPLLAALEYRNEEIAKLLLNTKKINVNAHQTSLRDAGKTALWHASNAGLTEIVKLLLASQDINVNAYPTDDCDENNQTPLWIAINKGHLEIAKLLLQRDDIDVSACPISGDDAYKTPLLIAARDNQVDIVKLLLKKEKINVNAHPTSGPMEGITPLYLALSHGQEDTVKLLLQIDNIDVNIVPSEGQNANISALFIAADHGYKEIVKLLIQKGADLNLAPSAGPAKGVSPLWIALLNGHKEVAELLLENGARLGSIEKIFNTLSAQGFNISVAKTTFASITQNFAKGSVLWNALNEGSEEFAKLLIANGADVNASPTTGDAAGITPLMLAADRGYEDVVELLIDKGAKIEATTTEDNAGKTPLWIAAARNNIKILELLFKKVPKINVNPAPIAGNKYEGRTPLWIAAKAGYKEVVELLLKQEEIDVNAHPTTEKHAGKTPLFVAMAKDHMDIVKLLLQREDIDVNASPTTGDEAGLTALHLAAGFDNKEVVEALIAKGAYVNAAATSAINKGMTPLWVALISGNIEIVNLLLAHGAKIGPVEENLRTLHAQGYDITAALTCFEAMAQEHDNILAVVNAIAARNFIYKLKTHIFAAPETGSHDVSFAKQTLAKTKEYFDKHQMKQVTAEAYDETFKILRDMIIARFMHTPGISDEFKAFIEKHKDAKTIEKQILRTQIAKDRSQKAGSLNQAKDIIYGAYEWIMTFTDNIMLRTDPAMELAKEMLSYIIASRDDLLLNGKLEQSKQIEDTLIAQLDNAMDANEGTMSCAPGTPRFLRVVLQNYLDIVQPPTKETKHNNVQESTANIIDNLLRVQLNKVSKKYHHANNAKDLMIYICDALATVGVDNAANIAAGMIPEGRASGNACDSKAMHLRGQIMYKAYPNFDAFRNAVIANLGGTNNTEITLSAHDEHYLLLMYYAIVDAAIRNKLYQSLDTALTAINKEAALLQIPGALTKALELYSLNKTKNLRQLKETMRNFLELKIVDIDREKRDRVVDEIIGTKLAYGIKEPAQILKYLEQQYTGKYDIPVKPSTKRRN